MLLVMITVTLLILTRTVSAQQTAGASCFKGPDEWRIRFMLLNNGVNIQSVFAIDMNDDTELSNECSSSNLSFQEVTGSGSTADPWILINSYTPSTGTFNYNCGASRVGNKFTWKFRSGSSAILVDYRTDFIFIMECDFDTVDNNLDTNVDVGVTGDIRSFDVAASQEVVSLYVRNAAGIEVTTAALGQVVRMALDMDVNAVAKGVYAYDCELGDMSDFTGEILRLTDSAGCTLDSFFLASGFVALDATGRNHDSGEMTIVAFRTGMNVYLRCKLEYCYTDADPVCMDSCTAMRRRKREASVNQTSSKSSQVQAHYVVTLFKDESRTRADKADPQLSASGEGTDSNNGGTCFETAVVIAVFSVMAILCSLATAVSIFICIRYTRKMSRKDAKC